jgi:hypothetical protein
MSELSEVYSVTKNGVRYLATKEFKGVGRPTTTVYVPDKARNRDGARDAHANEADVEARNATIAFEDDMGLGDFPTISPKQRLVLNLLLEWHQGSMLATAHNYKRIATEMGWKNHGGVTECLYALRAKGAVRSVGKSMERPDQWEVCNGAARSDDAQ